MSLIASEFLAPFKQLIGYLPTDIYGLLFFLFLFAPHECSRFQNYVL